MNKRLLACAAITTLLVGCEHFRPDTLPDSTKPKISVVAGRIVVFPEVLLFPPRQRGIAITWQLPADSPLRFPDNGIVIEGQIIEQVIRSGGSNSVPLDRNQNQITECQRSKDELQFTCLNKHHGPGVFKYTIRVLDGQRRIERDPIIVNM